MYLVVPNGGYNADSLPVRVDLYHESAYLCPGTNKMKRLYLNIMKWFLPVLFISYMAGITLFTHSHVVNGVTIVHSHPFKKGVEHSHTTVEFQLIHFLNHFQTTDAGILPVFASFIALLLCTLVVSAADGAFNSLCGSGFIEGTSFFSFVVNTSACLWKRKISESPFYSCS